MSEEYRTVTATIKTIRERWILVVRPNAPGRACIPRSLIHGGDDIKLDGLDTNFPVGVEHTFRLVEWKAEQVGLS